ncbi:predicted protein [Nematostella vectensis]|uniref:Uncharacterized protein n=1 Tax=Nematostella vectensis TaxID=45351 RepID=A7S441_NEMVE|nr:predicted protein [Nematostella vectensis]|eukprot:XP_001633576.1 predicted protein [Nematostella vectensis]
MVNLLQLVWSSSWFNKVGAPQKLMEYVHRYGNRQARLAATELLLTNMNILQDLVRVCDNRILVGIVRQTGISKDIWKTTTKSSHKCPDEKAIEMSLKSLLLSLPPSGVDECTRWFTKSAILSGTSAKQHKRSISWNFGGDHGLSFAHTLTSMPADQVELFYLKALTRHSTVS